MAGFVLSLEGVSVLHWASGGDRVPGGSKGRGEKETASQRGDGSGRRGRQLSKGGGAGRTLDSEPTAVALSSFTVNLFWRTPLASPWLFLHLKRAPPAFLLGPVAP